MRWGNMDRMAVTAIAGLAVSMAVVVYVLLTIH